MRKRVVSLRKRQQLTGTLHLSLRRRRPSPNLNSQVRHRFDLHQALEQVDAAYMAMPAQARMAFVVHRVRGCMTAWTEIEPATRRGTAEAFEALVQALSGEERFDGLRGNGIELAEGCRWIAQVRVHGLSIAQRRALLEWVAASPDNGRALIRAEVIWQAADAGPEVSC